MADRLVKTEIYRVSGSSMNPTLKDGDEVEVLVGGRFSLGDIVVVKHPYKRDLVLIKRVADIRDDKVFLRGDNAAESEDGFGGISAQSVIGVAKSHR